MSNNTFAIKSSCQIVRPRKKRKRSRLEDEPLVKDEVSGSAYGQAEPDVGQGDSVKCGGQPRTDVGIGSGSLNLISSPSRWTKSITQVVRMSPQKRTASQQSPCSQVQVTETRNANGREMGDGIPTQSSAAVSVNE
ncbi:hypothetical protein Tco_1090742 [Tanacetum coccineum]|uniref:Uncharacterized protein n=1 Tax=Tanacetum coccineum TaxID=301880 RepID=A0ABQ5I673_9ASTR